MPPADSPAERWLDTQDDDLTTETVKELLEPIPDDLWVAAACVDRVVDVIDVQRCILETGLSRTYKTVQMAKEAVELAKMKEEEDEEDGKEDTSDPLQFDDDVRELLAMRRILLKRLDILRTYEEMAKKAGWSLGESEGEDLPVETSPVDDVDSLDPWADTPEEEPPAPAPISPPSTPPPLNLSSFLLTPIIQSAFVFAASLQLPALATLFNRHTAELFPYRLQILDIVPLYAQPSEFQEVAPSFDYRTSEETLQTGTPWREVLDWTEAEGADIVNDAEDALVSFAEPVPSPYGEGSSKALTADELSTWYSDRVRHIDSELGLVDVALSLVQHGASQGIPGLDELGEQLSLLSRLVYDTGSDAPHAEWNLSRWRSMDTDAVVLAYLSSSTPSTIASDIRRLVLPYLYVLEAVQERAGVQDPDLPKRHLFHYVLTAPLPMAAAIFEGSKPTLPVSQRLIQKDDDMARLALACLYGSDALNEWGTMSQIFECLPAWQSAASEEDAGSDAGAADNTLRSLASFVTPSATRPKASSHDLLSFFEPLSAQALSRALDVVDVHLASGEILSRWDVPAPLRWFLQSADDAPQQRAWATRMARRNVWGDDVEEDDDEWINLMKDMTRLVGGGEGALRGAFGLLSKDEVKKIFFEGLLSMGKFKLAKRLLNPKHGHRPLTPDVIETICLSMSREFYDNANSGNLYMGEMRLAYDCLSVAPATPATISEREFIEATSKICSYGVHSRPGVPLAPIEIRLVKDRLSLVSRVLSSNDNVYKHAEVVLEIVHKLGYRNDLAAEVKTYAMLADAATQAEDFPRAADMSDRMVQSVQILRRTVLLDQPSHSSNAADDRTITNANEAVEVCWHTCFQLGRQPEFHDAKRKMSLLAYAVQLCPPENVLDVLAVWRRVEGETIQASPSPGRGRYRAGARASERIKARNNRLANAGGGMSVSLQAAAGQIPSLSTRLLSMRDAQLPISSDAAKDMASRTFNRMAGVAANLPTNLPFSLRGRLQSDDANSSRSGRSGRSPGSDVSHQAKAAFARGVGWLIGTDDEE